MTTLTPFHQFIQQKHEEARRAAPHADVRLVPEAEGYAVYASDKQAKELVARRTMHSLLPVMPVEHVNGFIHILTQSGHSVALLDKVRLSAHGGWRLVLIAEIPATGSKAVEEKEDEDFA